MLKSAFSVLIAVCVFLPVFPAGAAPSRLKDGASRDETVDEGGPSSQTRVYFNARIAMRERRYKDVIRLWLLHNALESKGERPEHESDFRSVVWAALAAAGLCHDGLRDDDDDDGAGLWPLALHNWLTRSSSRQPAPAQPRAFTSFLSGFQQRLVSVHDVLSAEELKGMRFFRRDCRRPYLALAQLQSIHWLDLDDRLSRGIMMRDLIEKAQVVLRHERMRGEVLLETRLFDLDLALVKLAKSKARRETGLLAQVARSTGVSEPAMTMLRDATYAELRASQFADLLRRCLIWDERDWMALSLNRRIALYRSSRENNGDIDAMKEKLRSAMLLNIDVAIREKDGPALNLWLGFARPGAGSGQSQMLSEITEGVRGERLLSLGPEVGFRERGVIALRRATAALAAGESLDAMRAFALAMQRSEESRKPDLIHRLSKRWFAYVLAQHEVNAEVLAILNTFVSPVDRNELLEVLLWRSAFHADAASFDRSASAIRKGGSLDSRAQKLRLLSTGDVSGMYRSMRRDVTKRPNAIIAFTKRLTEELATESIDVRVKNQVTIELGMKLLLEADNGKSRGLSRRIDEQIDRMQTLLDGLEIYDVTPEGRVRAAAPGAEAYAGSVRLAPADPLPWPFAIPGVQAPSPFSPIKLTPVEWVGPQGTLVFGWRLHE